MKEQKDIQAEKKRLHRTNSEVIAIAICETPKRSELKSQIADTDELDLLAPEVNVIREHSM